MTGSVRRSVSYGSETVRESQHVLGNSASNDCANARLRRGAGLKRQSPAFATRRQKPVEKWAREWAPEPEA